MLLFAMSLSDLLTMEKRRRTVDPESLGAVPIGVPRIVGPAVLTTSILLVSLHGLWCTVLTLGINIALAGLIFRGAARIHRFLGNAESKAISKLASILLAAIAVMMVRKGMMIFLAG